MKSPRNIRKPNRKSKESLHTPTYHPAQVQTPTYSLISIFEDFSIVFVKLVHYRNLIILFSFVVRMYPWWAKPLVWMHAYPWPTTKPPQDYPIPKELDYIHQDQMPMRHTIKNQDSQNWRARMSLLHCCTCSSHRHSVSSLFSKYNFFRLFWDKALPIYSAIYDCWGISASFCKRHSKWWRASEHARGLYSLIFLQLSCRVLSVLLVIFLPTSSFFVLPHDWRVHWVFLSRTSRRLSGIVWSHVGSTQFHYKDVWLQTFCGVSLAENSFEAGAALFATLDLTPHPD
jgi:hypothetical protein